MDNQDELYTSESVPLIEGVDIPYSQEHLRMVEQTRELLFPKSDEEIKAEGKENQSPGGTSPKITAAPPRGYFENGKFVAPVYDRLNYMDLVYQFARETRYSGYRKITSPRVYFREDNDHINLFHPDLVKCINTLLDAYPYDKMIIVKGMSVPNAEFITPHNTGMAIDIYAHTLEERNHIMNSAWTIGIPNIVQAGEDTADIHVHLDILPADKWVYTDFHYQGPWSLSRYS